MSDDSGFVPPRLRDHLRDRYFGMSDTGALASWFEEVMPQALKFFDDLPSGPASENVRPADQFGFTRDTGPSKLDSLLITKRVGYIEVPDELLMDAGIIPDTRPPLPPPSWRTRLRWKRDQWRETAARRAYRLIAGYEMPDYGE